MTSVNRRLQKVFKNIRVQGSDSSEQKVFKNSRVGGSGLSVTAVSQSLCV